jgi:peptidoglycan/xylan/chitin deacetylase (PgdA/CDA1 family)
VRELIVLCYHAVSERWPASLAVTPEHLESQLQLLVARGYRGSTFTEAVTRRPKGKVVAVTFDDAFRSVHQWAVPILTRLGLPGTVFVPTGFIGELGGKLSWPGIENWVGGPCERELLGMSWSELRQLAELGWEIGSHSHSHARLTALDDRRLRGELLESRATLEGQLGRPCRSLAYPYGDHDARVVEAARVAGYRAGGTLPGRLRPREPLAWPRIGIYNKDDRRRYRLKVSRPVRAARALPLWPKGDDGHKA